jgi:ElaA protein
MENNFIVKDFSELNVQELYDIMYLRQVVFVVEQDAAYVDADKKDFKSIHILQYKEDTLVAYARVLAPGVSYQEASIGRVVSAPEWRRKKLGRPLMHKCIEVLNDNYKTNTCRISAQTYLLPFYGEFGFQVCGEEYLEDGLPHFEMLRK